METILSAAIRVGGIVFFAPRHARHHDEEHAVLTITNPEA